MCSDLILFTIKIRGEFVQKDYFPNISQLRLSVKTFKTNGVMKNAASVNEWVGDEVTDSRKSWQGKSYDKSMKTNY